MTYDAADSASELDMPTEIIVPSEWAEAMFAKGQLMLTPDQIDLLENNSTISLPRELVEAANPPRVRKNQVEWINPIDAVHWLSPKIGGDAAAKSTIVERLRDGAIECSFVWMSVGPDIGPISNKRPNYPIIGAKSGTGSWVTPIHRGKGPIILGWAIWHYSDDWDADLNRWNWREGVLVASSYPTSAVVVDGVPINELKMKARKRMVVSGVRFSRDDIAKIFGGNEAVFEEARSSSTNRGRKGPRRKKFNYGPVLAQLQSEILSGAISRLGHFDEYGAQASLESEITEKLTRPDGSIPAESTVRRRAVELMVLWRQHGSQGRDM